MKDKDKGRIPAGPCPGTGGPAGGAAPAGADPAADAERARLTARLAHLARAERRQRPVFLLFLASELLAQFPYWLLRGLRRLDGDLRKLKHVHRRKSYEPGVTAPA